MRDTPEDRQRLFALASRVALAPSAAALAALVPELVAFDGGRQIATLRDLWLRRLLALDPTEAELAALPDNLWPPRR